MKYIIILFILFLLLPLAFAETTFFDQDDTFIMGDSITGGTTSGGCTYRWNCTSWSECLPSEKQTRTCSNIGTCSDTYKPPKIEQNCTQFNHKNPQQPGENNTNNSNPDQNSQTGKQTKNNYWIYFVVIIAIVVLIAVVLFNQKRNKRYYLKRFEQVRKKERFEQSS